MSRIRKLESHVADLIAAGEVVERPGSVVKELLENAVDAGASAVTVEIQNGGMSYIRVTDNGCGIQGEDAETAFLRHATSKIRDESDLAAIDTLGFRGEALAAVAAVSRVDLLTCARGEELGTSLSLEAGVPGEKMPAGCPEGTTVVVRNLFYNTPARLKFMKKDSAEAANIASVAQNAALSHPEVSVRLIRDGREELRTPGDGLLLSAIYAALGREFALGLLEAGGTGEDVRAWGYVTKPVCGHGTRGYQHFFVNGRYVKSRLLTAALEEAYKNRAMTGRFPGCVLHLKIRPGAVDVNVHPAKTEIKFLSERRIFDAVYQTVRSALDGEAERPEIRLRTPDDISCRPRYPERAGNVSPAVRQSAYSGASGFQTSVFPADAEMKDTGLTLGSGRFGVYGGEPPAAAVLPVPPRLPEEISRPAPSVSRISATVSFPETPAPDGREKPPEREPVAEQTPGPFRILGEALCTYIVVEESGGLLFIDKHAAHERILFDRLAEEPGSVMAQVLLSPVVTALPREETSALLDQRETLSEFGFEVEDFGGGSLIVRQTPWDIAPGEISAALSELAACILDAKRADPKSVRNEMLSTIACKMAIKAGSRSSMEELAVLTEEVVAGRIRYCPHGRPVAVSLSRQRLEKQFGRI